VERGGSQQVLPPIQLVGKQTEKSVHGATHAHQHFFSVGCFNTVGLICKKADIRYFVFLNLMHAECALKNYLRMLSMH
jgi:hypothetical protein